MSQFKPILLTVSLLLAFGVEWTRADVIYDTYPKGTDGYYTVRSVGLSSPQAVAEQFTPSANYSFTSATLALFLVSGTNDFTVSIDDASGPGGTPGAALETFANVAATPDQTTDLTLNSVTHPELLSGDNYYLVAIAEGSDTYGGWTLVPTAGGPFDYGTSSADGGNTWGTINYGNAAAFEIVGAVPEPATLSLLGLGTVALLSHRHRLIEEIRTLN
jgi:hypothetical protein